MRARTASLAFLVVAATSMAARAQDGDGPDEEPVPSDPSGGRPAVERGSSVEVIVGLAGAGPGDARVITASGRVLARGAAGAAWTQLNRGGVSVELVQARGSGSDVWAAGAQPPAFRFSAASSTWAALPVRRSGAARLGSCAAPAFASGRRVFAHDGRRWKELRRFAGKAAIATLCIVDLASGAILHEDGLVSALAGGAWRPVALPAPATWLGGGASALVGTAPGQLYRLVGGKAARVALDPKLRELAPRAAASSAKHTWLLGASAGALVIVRLDARRLTLVDTLPAALAVHDWLGLLAGDDGTLLLAARDGTLALRGADGTWTSEKLRAEPPAATSGPANPPARVGGAR